MACSFLKTRLSRLAVRPGLLLLVAASIRLFAAPAIHFDLGRKLYQSGKYTEALQELIVSGDAAELAPQRDLYAGMCDEQLGQWPAASVRLSAYVSANPLDAAGWYWLGSAQLLQKNFADALASFGRAVKYSPDSADNYRGLGLAQLELKDYQDAYQAWSKAVQLDTNDEKSRYYLGRLFYEADLPEQGAVWLRQALALAPDDYEVLTYLGLCAEALRFDSTAFELYRKAVVSSNSQTRPYAKAYLSLGTYLSKHGEDKQALAVLEEGARKCPEAHELAALGALLATQHQNQRAEAVLREAITLEPSLSQPHYRLGLLLASAGKIAESRKEMDRFQEAKKLEDQYPKITALQK